MRQSLTYDQGKELTRHKDLTARTGVAVYFCEPHTPWQCSTCGNANGLLRQYLPKGTDLSVYSQEQLDEIADNLNTRPRATLSFRSPLVVFTRMLALTDPRRPRLTDSSPLHLRLETAPFLVVQNVKSKDELRNAFLR